jgi:ribosomal protein S18 acetylase RimI-like enzyme
VTARAVTVDLRPPRAEHRDRVREIVEATGVFRREEVGIALEVFDSAMAAPGLDYTAVGAFDDEDRLVGFACYGHTPCTESTWDLYWIAVDPGAYRQGVGRKLLDACEAGIAALGGELVVAETSSRTDYDATRTFYEARGYTAAARIAGFYAPQDDLVVYTKRLGPQEEDDRHP